MPHKVAIVGNGSSLIDLRLGKEIDSHDVVIRTNLFFLMIDENITGLKSDIWSCSFHIGYDQNIIFPARRIWVPRPLEWDESDPEHWSIPEVHKRHVEKELSQEEFKCLSEDMKKKNVRRSLSTGIVTFLMACKEFKDSQIDVYGFDFYKPSNYYYNTSIEKVDYSPHSIDSEESFFKHFIIGKNINWVKK